jgi:hypothetical protein
MPDHLNGTQERFPVLPGGDRFSLRRSTARARAVLRASSIYLPALLTLWLLEGIPHGYNLPR